MLSQKCYQQFFMTIRKLGGKPSIRNKQVKIIGVVYYINFWREHFLSLKYIVEWVVFFNLKFLFESSLFLVKTLPFFFWPFVYILCFLFSRLANENLVKILRGQLIICARRQETWGDRYDLVRCIKNMRT